VHGEESKGSVERLVEVAMGRKEMRLLGCTCYFSLVMVVVEMGMVMVMGIMEMAVVETIMMLKMITG